MYDALFSAREGSVEPIKSIPPEVQSKVLRDQSESLWRWIENSLSSSIDNCSLEQANGIYNLLDMLGHLFRHRLLNAKSEPRALAFSISAMTAEYEAKIMPLMHIARRAQLIYFRTGPAKDEGGRETYFVPNRMLWPVRGLDVVGQHARVSLKARDVWAAVNGAQFPLVEDQAKQSELFDVGD